MPRIYGYCRVSTPTQHIERQIENISKAYPDSKLVQEKYTGMTIDRPEWTKLMKRVVEGDTIVFDSVSRMSRNAEEGFDAYKDLFGKGIELIFLKEPYLNTATYKTALDKQIELTGTDIDLILSGVNAYLLRLAEQQIRIAFDQSEKEVTDLRQRTKEGIETARKRGKQIGRAPGVRLHTQKEKAAKEVIWKHAAAFGGTLRDPEVIKLAGISRNTYYKYKSELFSEQRTEDGI